MTIATLATENTPMTAAVAVTPLQLRVLEFCWSHICDEEETPTVDDIARHARVSGDVAADMLTGLERRNLVDLRFVDGERHVWRVRLPDGRSANMDLIERG
jgi:hypothetical protein